MNYRTVKGSRINKFKQIFWYINNKKVNLLILNDKVPNVS